MITTIEKALQLCRAARETEKQAEGRGDNTTATQYLYLSAEGALYEAQDVLREAIAAIEEQRTALWNKADKTAAARRAAQKNNSL